MMSFIGMAFLAFCFFMAGQRSQGEGSQKSSHRYGDLEYRSVSKRIKRAVRSRNIFKMIK